MQIQSIEFIHLKLPFKHRFVHASQARSAGDTILVKLVSSEGLVGFGEILPRPYVTGESISSILESSAPDYRTAELAAEVMAQPKSDQQTLLQWLDEQLPYYQRHTALFGGVELALWNLLSQKNQLNLDSLLGPLHSGPRGQCVTLGFDAETDNLRKYAIDARLKGATVVKLKIGLPDDIKRLQSLDKCFKGKLPIRVDANGLYDADRAQALLQACAGSTALQSFEEPFARNDCETVELQKRLYEQYGIDFVADESVCSLADARVLHEQGAFQALNLRVGKHGGLYAARQIRDFATQHAIGLVSGSMVGESGVLTQAGELMLSRSAEFDYVEGLGQNTQFLLIDPVAAIDGNGPMSVFRLKEDECKGLVQNKLVFTA